MSLHHDEQRADAVDLDITSHVTPAAATREKTPPVVRLCSVCSERLPGGIAKHPECRLKSGSGLVLAGKDSDE